MAYNPNASTQIPLPQNTYLQTFKGVSDATKVNPNPLTVEARNAMNRLAGVSEQGIPSRLRTGFNTVKNQFAPVLQNLGTQQSTFDATEAANKAAAEKAAADKAIADAKAAADKIAADKAAADATAKAAADKAAYEISPEGIAAAKTAWDTAEAKKIADFNAWVKANRYFSGSQVMLPGTLPIPAEYAPYIIRDNDGTRVVGAPTAKPFVPPVVPNSALQPATPTSPAPTPITPTGWTQGTDTFTAWTNIPSNATATPPAGFTPPDPADTSNRYWVDEYGNQYMSRVNYARNSGPTNNRIVSKLIPQVVLPSSGLKTPNGIDIPATDAQGYPIDTVFHTQVALATGIPFRRQGEGMDAYNSRIDASK